jgi:hypothetical protein
MRYHGRVVKKPFGVGSKSEHDAVMLVTDAGEFVLRRVGGNAFRDPQLDQLVGKSIAAEGTLHGYTLIMSAWQESE